MCVTMIGHCAWEKAHKSNYDSWDLAVGHVLSSL